MTRLFHILLNCSSNALNETKRHGRMGLGALVAFSYDAKSVKTLLCSCNIGQINIIFDPKLAS
jgi:hypothetical protein